MEKTSPGTTANDLGSVQKTLLLPLWGRAVETKKRARYAWIKPPSRIVESIDYDFFTMVSHNRSKLPVRRELRQACGIVIHPKTNVSRRCPRGQR
jgi:O-methyltransferase involved in polyketide biosynthesis